MIPTAAPDYTDRDFDAVRLRLHALIRSVFPEWTDFDVASFGNTLVDLFAFVGDVLSFYQDAQARETRLVTATPRKNVIALASMLGYALQGTRAATAEVVVRLERPPIASVTLPAGTVVRTEEITPAVRFQLLAPVVFAPGASSPEVRVIVEHSRSHQRLATANALPDFEIALEQTPFLDGSLVVSTAAGVWSEVESFLGSGPVDRHFTVRVDDGDRATLRFGNGNSGAIPTGTVSVLYKTGGGATGNVETDRLRVVEGAFTDAAGRPVLVSATNPLPASGGADRESVASARLRAPQSLRALTRTVSREDFEVNALRLRSVARALMLTANEDASIGENEGVLYVVPTGGGVPTPALKNLVYQQVTEVYPCTLTFLVRVQDPLYRRVDVRARLFLRPGVAAADVRERVRSRLSAHFRVSEPDGTPNPRIDFGFNLRDAEGNPNGEIAWSDIFDVIRDTAGVRKLGDGRDDLLLSGLPADVKLRLNEFPQLGTVTLIDGDTGAVL
jgi:hypothetical protein